MLVYVRFVVESGTLTVFSPSTFVFPCQYYPTSGPCIYKLFLRREETEVVFKYSKGSVLFEIGGTGQTNTPFSTWPCLERVSVRLDRCATASIRVQPDGRPTGKLDPGFP